MFLYYVALLNLRKEEQNQISNPIKPKHGLIPSCHKFNYLLFLSNNIISTGNHLKTFVNNTYYLLAFLDLGLEKRLSLQ